MISQHGLAPLAQEVVSLLSAVLRADLVAAYLHGSAVCGGLRPHSDVDILAVTRRPTTHAQRRVLVDRLLAISGRRARRGQARPVELTVVVHSDVRPWHYPPQAEFQYGEWLRDECEQGIMPEPGEMPDLALLITQVLAADHPLVGPPPHEVLDPVPQDDLRRAIVAGIPALLADLPSDTANVVLTLARTWLTLATGAIRSKDVAADWALERLPARHRPVLARARAIYLGDAQDRWDDLAAEVVPHAETVVNQIRRLR